MCLFVCGNFVHMWSTSGHINYYFYALFFYIFEWMADLCQDVRKHSANMPKKLLFLFNLQHSNSRYCRMPRLREVMERPCDYLRELHVVKFTD